MEHMVSCICEGKGWYLCLMLSKCYVMYRKGWKWKLALMFLYILDCKSSTVTNPPCVINEVLQEGSECSSRSQSYSMPQETSESSPLMLTFVSKRHQHHLLLSIQNMILKLESNSVVLHVCTGKNCNSCMCSSIQPVKLL